MSKRLVSLDAFRGFTIVFMILIDNLKGDTFAQLEHAAWNGWTFSDTIFPFFLWITGTSIVFSFSKRKKNNSSKKDLTLHVFKRATVLFLLGLFINAFPFFHLSSLRIPGILQRIAVCYLFASLIYIFSGTRGIIASLILLLTGYWLIITNLGINFPQSIDVLLLKNHLFTPTFDPEGIISTIAATSTVLFGILGGLLINHSAKSTKNSILLIIAGCFLIVFGSILNYWLPINKYLWTSSYSIFMSGIAFVIFGGFYFLIEHLQLKKYFQSFVVFGINPLFLYISSVLLTSLLTVIPLGDMYYQLFTKVSIDKVPSVLYATTHVILFYGIALIFYRNKWIIKI